jgi:hypothetical protein
MEHVSQDAVVEHSMKFNNRVKIGLFNLVVEFIVFLVIAFFNYSWIERFTRHIKPQNFRVAYQVTGNLLLLFAFLIIEKQLHEQLFDFTKRGFPEVFYLILNLSVFILAIIVAKFLILYRRNKISEIENIRLKEEKTRAELTALKEQISPHFFFNTLSTLSSIVRNEPREQGLIFIQDMSSTYRYAISSGKKDLVSLKEELEFLESYVYLIKKRFGEKLSVNILPTEEPCNRFLPPMSLQVLVENAIQHNIITQAKPLEIDIFIDGEFVVVRNKLQEKVSSDGFGVGLQNLSNRFQLLSQKDIIIEKSNVYFVVKLPLL